MMLKLKLQYFGHLMRRVDSLEKTDAGRDWGQRGEGDDRGWDGWMASLTRWTWVWVNSGSWWWTGRPSMLQFMWSQSWTQLSDWTELKDDLVWSINKHLSKHFLCSKHWSGMSNKYVLYWEEQVSESLNNVFPEPRMASGTEYTFNRYLLSEWMKKNSINNKILVLLLSHVTTKKRNFI